MKNKLLVAVLAGAASIFLGNLAYAEWVKRQTVGGA